ncbi:tyrosine-type recombinase/integrase [Peptostreptococcus canis]|uniref:Tyrosine-type recombinase/integrase n=1 Tax=Peptostreptococcus canis TaxID=1159213 RepID=A0ABR6TK83_9FIRM|nr:tyrosine-type recombinase/integrase [Peptostreptococcus canis]MBC2575725.1 tyrosine-type recombinase/integrase [Peptostreptococcus canis]MBP1998160.1 site-specific recombinase XerD [Peptostreptococcus canis]
MATRINNKSSKPDNIVIRDNNIIDECESIEKQLPQFMKDYFIYLRGAVAVTSRRAYLQDIKFFCDYLISTDLYTNAKQAFEITLDEFKEIKARDINLFLGDYCNRYYKIIKNDKTNNDDKVLYENNNKSLARKKSSLSTLFKYMYRNEQLNEDITAGFNPIKLPKPQPDAIKRLEIDEVAIMLDAVENGTGLTDKEKEYWLKTKLRDRAILVLFITYGLRLTELRELNISSFNFSRGVFVIFRKRGKEVQMPINDACEKVIKEYIEFERPKEDMLSEDNKDALFLSLQKKRMTTRSIRDLVKKYTSISMGTSRENGYSPHKLRATAATSLIETGFSIYDVQNLMDHENVTTTQLYAAHRKNLKRDIVKNFDWLDEDNALGVKRRD